MRATRRRRRAPKVLGWLVVIALLAGAAFVARQFFFAPSWTDETAPLAAFVESQRSISFDEAVKVTTLEAPAFAARAYDVLVDVGSDDAAAAASTARALGLLQGELKSVPTSQLAGEDRVAFYDPGSDTIFVDGSVDETTRRAALVRELDLALLDQHFGWGDRLDDLTGAQHLAFVTALVGEAELTGRGWTASGGSSATGVPDADGSAPAFPSLTGLADASGTPADVALGLSLPHLGGPLAAGTSRAGGSFDLASLAGEVPASDLALVDLLAPVATASTEAQRPDGVDTLGATTWFLVLAGRLDAAQAWDAAAAWGTDTTEVFQQGEQTCVRSEITGRDGVDALGLAASLQQWASLGPPEAGAKVEVGADGVITVQSCDPGAGAGTIARPGAVPALIAYTVFEHDLLQRAATASSAPVDTLGDCVLSPARQEGLIDDLVAAAGASGWDLGAVDRTAADARIAALAAACPTG